MHVLHVVVHYKKVTRGVFFDIEGALNRAKTVSICDALKNRSVTDNLVEWVSSAL